MALKFKGKVCVFGDNLDVDYEIVPFRKFDAGLIKLEDVGKWCMSNVDPDFPKKVKKGDIMVAGSNMGCGHDHFQANLAIKQCGISVVIAESFDRNFFRNSIGVGLPIVEYKGIKKEVKEGDELEVDLHAGTIKNLTSGKNLKFKPFPDFLQEILEVGGMDPYADKLVAEGKVNK
jgi:3-isopropylmalate/(R)-2-methylmalate dehydratase small subunit